MPKRILKGKVVSCNNDKTVVVEVRRQVQHPLYKKIIKRNKKFHAHDENNSLNIGEIVSIQESKPISKLKKWIVINDSKKESQ
tara:strand:- start:5092 stop:5340 length:249 start_codon:yes stop_codon:yes gene_type:complete